MKNSSIIKTEELTNLDSICFKSSQHYHNKWIVRKRNQVIDKILE